MHEITETTSQSVAASDTSRHYTSPIESLRGVARFHEETVLKRFIEALPLPEEHSFLDVGCGYGRKMEWLRERGINATGVDINPTHVQAVRDMGMNAISIEEFDSSSHCYDGMLMSHIIEHFTPDRLLEFMDRYLARLKIGGYLVISTPMPWVAFLEDFDHVRPYPPAAIQQVFGSNTTQIQYHAKSRLELLDLAVRRVPYSISPTDLAYSRMHTPGLMWWLRYRIGPAACRRVFRYTGGVLGGGTNGWMGVFKRVV